MTIQIKASKEARVIVGYGPQENLPTVQRMPFFATLEEEIVSAKLANKSIIIQMDANSKLGKELIPNDPKDQSPNGAVLAGIIKRNALIVVNSLETKVKGLITRKRVTVDGVEESVIDFVIVSSDLVEDIEELIIDEEKDHALTKIVRGNATTKVIKSDHNVMITKFRLKCHIENKPPTTVFNLNNKTCQQIFKRETTNTNKLSKIFHTNNDINQQTKKFLKVLKSIVHKSFKKVKIRKDRKSEYQELYTKWTHVRNKEDEVSIRRSGGYTTRIRRLYNKG